MVFRVVVGYPQRIPWLRLWTLAGLPDPGNVILSLYICSLFSSGTLACLFVSFSGLSGLFFFGCLFHCTSLQSEEEAIPSSSSALTRRVPLWTARRVLWKEEEQQWWKEEEESGGRAISSANRKCCPRHSDERDKKPRLVRVKTITSGVQYIVVGGNSNVHGLYQNNHLRRVHGSWYIWDVVKIIWHWYGIGRVYT